MLISGWTNNTATWQMTETRNSVTVGQINMNFWSRQKLQGQLNYR